MSLTALDEKTRVRPAKDPSSPLACVIAGSDEANALLAEWDNESVSLVFVACRDWNSQLSPWPAPACFKGGGAFAGGADAFLSEITESLLPAAERALGLKPCARAVAGESLAGLFALYALMKGGPFTMAASVSGSLWFDGWAEYFLARPLPRNARVYLSLGDREEFTRNARLSAVGERTREAYALLSSRGIESTLEMNPGNHFAEPEKRMAKALRWLFDPSRVTPFSERAVF